MELVAFDLNRILLLNKSFLIISTELFLMSLSHYITVIVFILSSVNRHSADIMLIA